ncbi:hypothetical protein J2Z69_003033 [Paenibacillus shirakamiensis]|uniref:Uncharacterized protein n=1 Tax=Paenibacillus shirakamiensis TaxID=1265935 RepID=A0ABS4JJV6_9BACL|nr:hypothetical protein [Paenibacillus shirakamiensis]MBP2001977.1 hypothetical protein [Paenibacillus shirakamiensis]
MAQKMDAHKAAGLLDKWVAFYDMNNPQAWERDEYGFVKDTCKAMQFASQILRGKGGTPRPAQLKDAADQLVDWVEEYEMDNPGAWEKENVAFVREVVEAINVAVSVLKGKK